VSQRFTLSLIVFTRKKERHVVYILTPCQSDCLFVLRNWACLSSATIYIISLPLHLPLVVSVNRYEPPFEMDIIAQSEIYMMQLQLLIEPTGNLRRHGFIMSPLTDEELLLKRRCLGCGKGNNEEIPSIRSN
jgi:hypothetical protein